MFSAGSYSHLWIMIGVCLLVLLAGIINFINIYLVVMLRRGKEYGLKKVFGARGKELFLRYMDREYFVGISRYAHSLGVCRSKYCASEKSFQSSV